MSRDRFDVLERLAPLFDAPQPSFEGFLRRRDRKRRNQRITAGVVGIAIFVTMVLLTMTGGPLDRTHTPLDTTPSATLPGSPEDYVIDLTTGVITPVPNAIIRSLGEVGEVGQYAVSPDGSQLAYVATLSGNAQIFMADIDGTGVHQLTHDTGPATSPAWSPDGTRIAYVGYGNGDALNLFVLDVATGESSQITSGTRVIDSGLQFTPDGSSLLYTGGGPDRPALRIVQLSGEANTLLIGTRGNLHDAGNGSLSPDGSFVTFLGSESGDPGPGHWVSNADGTGRRRIFNCTVNPSGAWSPDGNRIVCSGQPNPQKEPMRIWVVDIATGLGSPVAEGAQAIWLSPHTLLVDA